MLDTIEKLTKHFLTAFYDKKSATIKELKNELHLIDRNIKIENRNKIITFAINIRNNNSYILRSRKEYKDRNKRNNKINPETNNENKKSIIFTKS